MTPPTDTPAAVLAEGFARHAERWAIARGADAASAAAAREAARQLSLATTDGHVCVLLDELGQGAGPVGPAGTLPGGPALPTDAAGWRRALAASGITGTPAAPGSHPLILDDEGRLYLHRDFDHERRLAARLLAATQAPPWPVAAPVRERLQQLFSANRVNGGDAVDWQQAAAALALRQRLVVISGGPGTGKTTTVVNLLACLIEQLPGCRVALAAPTGKAAARLSEALRERAGHLPPALRERLPGEASTVHRLLGVTPAGFVHDARHPLPLDVLVVDEASMLDLALARRLLDAVPEPARIILLGDKDQLAAVESGAVFAELSANPRLSAACAADIEATCGWPAGRLQPPATPDAAAGLLDDAVIWFTRNFRFAADSAIGHLAADIAAARVQPALDGLRAGDETLHWLDDAGPKPGEPTVRAIADGYAPYFETVRRDPRDIAAVSAAFGRCRVLCAVRDGARGVTGVNAQVTRQAAQAMGLPPAGASSAWYPGRPVMVLRNDYVLRLYNGDIGIVLPDADGALAVFFPNPDGDGHRAVAPARLPPHETAYAMTVHKAQGSEFDDVLVLLPARRSRVLTRELLYTAVTRARRRVVLSAGATVLAEAIGAATQRHSGLMARLRDARA